jgi:protein-S-isoprenylcysteine O-methyltransferase Ste14
LTNAPNFEHFEVTLPANILKTDQTMTAESNLTETEGSDTKTVDAEGKGESSEKETPVAKESSPIRKKANPASRQVDLASTRWTRAAWRWLAVLLVMGVFLVIYLKHPIYTSDTFLQWRAVYPSIVALWTVLGLPYCFVTLRKFEVSSGMVTKVASAPSNAPFRENAKTDENREAATDVRPRGSLKFYQNDGALMLIILARIAWGKRNFAIWRQRRLRNTLLSMAVKGFFSPLMVGFFWGHVTGVVNLIANKKGVPRIPVLAKGDISVQGIYDYIVRVMPAVKKTIPNGDDFAAMMVGANYTNTNIHWGLDLIYNFIFIVDCGYALVGYLIELRWLGNKTRSVEPTGLGWACAIFCYPPFNNILGTYFPFQDRAQEWPLLSTSSAHLTIRVLIIIFFSIYAAATVAFGAKFSNLTNRGIVSRGPYAIIRHPAYTTKCIAWWLEHITRMTPQTALGLIGVCSVYACRAWTEERHLSQDPEYRAYKKKVKWAAIPGLF